MQHNNHYVARKVINKNKNRPKERGTTRMKRLSGFSLMEMMVVLLIVAVVAAASAPMVNKKMLNAAAEKSPWVWTGLNNSIAYNIQGAEIQTATIGGMAPPAGITPRLYVQTKDNSPAITLSQEGDGQTWNLFAKSNSIKLTPDANNPHSRSVVIGFDTVSDDGTVVIGSDVKLLPAAVAHGNITVTVSTTNEVSQPNAFADGATVGFENADITINKAPGSLVEMPANSNLNDLIRALNSIGVAPVDLISILQALKKSGSLQAELIII